MMGWCLNHVEIQKVGLVINQIHLKTNHRIYIVIV